jgi:hypothetical protein
MTGAFDTGTGGSAVRASSGRSPGPADAVVLDRGGAGSIPGFSAELSNQEVD